VLLWSLDEKPLGGKTLQPVFPDYNLSSEKSQHLLLKWRLWRTISKYTNYFCNCRKQWQSGWGECYAFCLK